MTPEQFCYWLQGFAEINPCDALSATQWTIVRDHLALVFNKVTPDRVEVTSDERKMTPMDEQEKWKKQYQDLIRELEKKPLPNYMPSVIPTYTPWTPNDPFAPSLYQSPIC